jgi:acyl-CoA thioesterase II
VLEARGSAAVLALGRLDSAAAARMALACVGGSRLPAAVLSFLAERAEGLPFLVEEVLAGLMGDGALAERDGRWHSADLAGSGLPVTFADAVGRRIDGLDADSRRVICGQVAAQALRAAGLTIDGRRYAHSLHCCFIRPIRSEEPLCFEVSRTRDGRASFHDPEPGEDWPPPASPSVPPAEDLRPVAAPETGSFPISHPFWVRVTTPDDAGPALHACLLTYLSDIAVVRSARAPASEVRHDLRVSLDHSVWFHRPPRVDQWLLYSMDPVAHVGTRALAQGSIRTAAGTLIASVAQEVLLRPADD